jgi:hydroxymethylbilane synthase
MGPDIVEATPEDLVELLRFVLDDAPSSVAVRAERAFLAAIEAGCTAPVGAPTEFVPAPAGAPGEVASAPGGAPAAGMTGMVSLRAVVASPDGREVLRRGAAGPAVDPEALGHRLADELLSAGAHTLMGNV